MNQHNERAELAAFLKTLVAARKREGSMPPRVPIATLEKIAALLEAQPAREWVGLTDEDTKAVHRDCGISYCVPADYDRHLFTHITDAQLMKVSRAIESKLREKNAGLPAAVPKPQDDLPAIIKKQAS